MRLRDITDPKHARKRFSRRHRQVSPDVTHVAVKKLISKGGHATIVSTHRGCGQDNRGSCLSLNFGQNVIQKSSPTAAIAKTHSATISRTFSSKDNFMPLASCTARAYLASARQLPSMPPNPQPSKVDR
jgi:hypothetical protein